MVLLYFRQVNVPRVQRLIIGARWSQTARQMRCGRVEAGLQPNGEGGCNSMLLSVNMKLTLVLVNTTLLCTPVAFVRLMYSILY